ncbi:outer membrane protein [Methylobacterium brachythecii]|uniref:Membrane protein n=1 Tax=Methylobacterium brachythecii TaxID=1176177 RepID=A0A7W6AFK9_9HYPH|nr:outer membrane beta-barrel protein [Methylobacterium brachythecii]MBB3902408.1 opacity protein-like surface antigen [Methylobacterium brachythecii]GLS42257.1 membrane protein [Methylobacterium brachythecii]
MRKLTIGFLALTALGSMSTARAADFADDYLRGPEYEPVTTQVIDWSGFYIGGHGGYSSSAFGFTNSFQPIVANALRSTTIESEMNASSLLSAHAVRKDGVSYGAFAGYNMQFDDTVIGVEFDYSRFDITGTTADAISRTRLLSDGYLSTANLAGIARTKLEDLGTIRARVGYAIGDFLPFVTGGFAIGRASISDKVGIQTYSYDRTTYLSNVASGQTAYVGRFGYSSFDQANPGAGIPFAPSIYGTSKTKVVGGFTLGGGVEYAITSNILLRGEYQYVLLNDFDGHKVNVNSVRGGAAYKF